MAGHPAGSYSAGVSADPLTQLTRCTGCGWHRPAGAPGCRPCVEWIDADIERAWARQVRELTPDGAADEAGVAEAVLADPRGVPWRVVDAAMLRVRCPDCGCPSGTGPAGCDACRLAHGHRFLAAEPDRPDVPAGNEHAIRVSAVVARWPQWFPAHMVPLYVMALPLLHAGDLPTTEQAQAIKAWIDRGVDLSVAAGATSFAEAHALLRRAAERVGG